MPEAIVIDAEHLAAPSVGTWSSSLAAGAEIKPGDVLGHILCNGMQREVLAPAATAGFFSSVKSGWVAYGQTIGVMTADKSADTVSLSGDAAKSGAAGEGIIVVAAETDGTIFLRPKPDAPLFAIEGSAVTQNQTLGLIEVMKTFTPVRSPMTGILVKVLVDDSQSVEDSSALFWIKAVSL